MRSISLILKQFSSSVLLVAGLAICGFTAYAHGDASQGEYLLYCNNICGGYHNMQKVKLL
jgi:heme/copper-type cytochrome/quinol oxidase subunit 2